MSVSHYLNKAGHIGSLDVPNIKVNWGTMKRGDSIVIESKETARKSVQYAKKYWNRHAKSEVIKEGENKGKFKLTLTRFEERSVWK